MENGMNIGKSAGKNLLDMLPNVHHGKGDANSTLYFIEKPDGL
jgi:hypothetical protein